MTGLRTSHTLWTLHLSRHVAGMVKGPVASLPSVYAGRWSSAERDLVRPDPDAIRACLPYRYRAAWDRTGGSLWHPDSHVTGWGASHVTLHDSRGKVLNTLYAVPYVFTVTAPA